MNLLSCYRDCANRVAERKKLLIVFGAIFFAFAVCGLMFIKTPAVYDYHLTLCDRFIDRVCFSDRSVFVIFLERTAGNLFLLGIVLCAGVHFVALIAPCGIIAYRAYTFGGSLYIFFSVYRFSGALIVFVLYLPIHIMIDFLLISATALSCTRTRYFCWNREDLWGILWDLLLLGTIVVLVCILEMIFLFALFHPLGNIL